MAGEGCEELVEVVVMPKTLEVVVVPKTLEAVVVPKTWTMFVSEVGTLE